MRAGRIAIDELRKPECGDVAAVETENQALPPRIHAYSVLAFRRIYKLLPELPRGEVQFLEATDTGQDVVILSAFAEVNARLGFKGRISGAGRNVLHGVHRSALFVDLVHGTHYQPQAMGKHQRRATPITQPFLWTDECA